MFTLWLENILKVVNQYGKVYVSGFHEFNKFEVLKGAFLILSITILNINGKIVEPPPDTNQRREFEK